LDAQKKCILLSEKLERFFQEGIVLNPDVLHFIDSTFAHPSLEELEDICEDESNIEKESLIELIFSPDESLQIQLESFLIYERFEKNDEKKVTDLLCSKALKTRILFPDGRGILKMNVPDEAVASFVSMLNIYWQPDVRIQNALDRISERFLKQSDGPLSNTQMDHIKASVTLQMRNKRADHSEMKTKTLCMFLENADIEDTSFFKCMNYLIDTMDGLMDTDDMYEILSQRKHQYRETIRQREAFESQLRKSNPETFFHQGVRAPFVNKDEMRKRIACIDTITLAVYGRIAYGL